MRKLIPDATIVKFLRLMAVISGVFSLLICSLIIITFIQLKRTDPLNTPALTFMQEHFVKNPADSVLQQQIRQVDLLARRAFFTSQWQIRTGGYLLVAGLLIVIICLKSIELITPKIPAVITNSPDEPWKRRRIQRRWIIIAGLLLMTFTLILTWYTHSILNGVSDQVSATNSSLSHMGSTAGEQGKQSSAGTANMDSSNLQAQTATDTLTDDTGFPAQQEIRSNFPCFRGPGGNGVDYHKKIPISWDGASGKNIRWKTEIPLSGYNSPIVWNDKVFLSGARENKKEVYCIDAYSGQGHLDC